MASKTVIDAVAARVSANWTYAPFYSVNVEGSVPADLSAFLDIEYPVSTENQITFGAIGKNVFRETGIIRFVLCIPIGQGINPWGGYIDELRDLFRAKQFSGVTTWSVDPPVINHQSDLIGYFELAVSVPYYFDKFA